MQAQTYTRIKGLSDIRRLPRLGRIRLGVKAISKGGKEYPKEVDYFVVPPEIQAIYGEKPKELDIMFPVEDERFTFPQSYKFYVSQGLRCKGDGETAQRRVADLAKGERVPLDGEVPKDPNAYVTVACPCPLLESGECRQNANLMVLLPKVSLGGVFQISTGSFHNIVRVNSCIDYVKGIVGRISMVPLKLIRQAEEIQFEGRKATHHLIQIVLNVNLEEAAKLRENSRMIISQSEKLSLPAPVEDGPEPTGEAVEAETGDVFKTAITSVTKHTVGNGFVFHVKDAAGTEYSIDGSREDLAKALRDRIGVEIEVLFEGREGKPWIVGYRELPS